MHRKAHMISSAEDQRTNCRDGSLKESFTCTHCSHPCPGDTVQNKSVGTVIQKPIV